MSNPNEEVSPEELTDAELEQVSGGAFDTYMVPDPHPPNPPPPSGPPPPELKI